MTHDNADPNGQHDARVQVLTAEVRTLMVGSRQVTLSVSKQLDEVDPDDIKPFGRICTGRRMPFAAIEMIEVIGRDGDGALARSTEIREQYWCGRGISSRMTVNGRDAIGMRCSEHRYSGRDHFWESSSDVLDDWRALPLIVLAGLR